MEKLIEFYENKMFIVWIDNIEYTAAFRNIDKELGFEINHYKKISKDIINREIKLFDGLIEDRQVTIIEPMLISYNDENVVFKFNMLLDGLSLGKNVKNKKIKSFECSYYGMNKFDFLRCISLGDRGNLKINYEKDTFKLDKGLLNFCRTSEMSFSKDCVTINKKYIFKHCYTYKVNIFEMVKDIWHFKNLFSIFSKKEIGVESIKVNCNEKNDATLFMNCVRRPEYYYKNEVLEIVENRFLIHYEDIKDNFEMIYNKSHECFERISPILQIYLDTLEKEMPKLNKFLSFNQMIEGFSREYFDKESFDEMIKNDVSKKNKREAELKYRISLLIKNVNFIYNFRRNRIMKISEKIALSRNYYIHHDKNRKMNQLSSAELLRYTYFLEDILLANIYLKLGIEKNVIIEALKNPFFYDISSL